MPETYDGYFVETAGSSNPELDAQLLQVSDLLEEANVILQINGQRVSDNDLIVFINKAIKYFYQTYKMPMAEREIDFLLFNGVFEYGLPADFAGIIEPERPYNYHSPQMTQTTSKSLSHRRLANHLAFKYLREKLILVVEHNFGKKTIVNSCESLTEDGTWAISGDGSNLTLDKHRYRDGRSSIRFTITAATGETVLTLTDISDLDITEALESSYLFVDLESMTDLSLAGVTLRIGDDASNYYEVGPTNSRYRGDAIGRGWGLIGFDLSRATQTGSPTGAVNYVAFVINNGTDGEASGIYRIDQVFLSEAVYFELPYYSKNIVRNNTTYKPKVEVAGDIILLPFSTFEAIQWKAMELAAVLSLKDESLAAYCARELRRPEAELRSKFPSKESNVQHTYYKRGKKF